MEPYCHKCGHYHASWGPCITTTAHDRPLHLQARGSGEAVVESNKEIEMKEWKYYVFVLLGIVSVCVLIVIAANTMYGKAELDAFNSINKTEYTMEQWRVYQYEIKKLHPFTGQK
jgi:hypothetical protein